MSSPLLQRTVAVIPCLQQHALEGQDAGERGPGEGGSLPVVNGIG